VLRCETAGFEQLSRRGVEAAARFDWSNIARQTVESYRAHLSSESQS